MLVTEIVGSSEQKLIKDIWDGKVTYDEVSRVLSPANDPMLERIRQSVKLIKLICDRKAKFEDVAMMLSLMEQERNAEVIAEEVMNYLAGH